MRYLEHVRNLGLAATLLSTLAASVSVSAEEPRNASGPLPPNIIFIVSDDHTAGDFGLADPKNFKTPNLNRLATEGVVFTRAYVSSPQCAPSRASLMTGRSALDIRSSRFSAPLARQLETFPQNLRGAGYFTGVIGRSHHLDGSPSQGPNADRVFDELNLRATRDRFDVVHVGTNYANQEQWVDGVLASFLDKRPSGAPFFLQFNFSDPHRPWTAKEFEPNPDSVILPPDMPNRPSVRQDFAQYVGEIERMDGLIGEIIDLLDTKAELHNTLIVFVGDNGAAILRGKGTLLENGINVPLIAWMPGTVPGGRTIDTLVSGEDIGPTFLEFANAPALSDATGISFADVLYGNTSQTGRRFAFATRGPHGIGLPTSTTLFDMSRAIVSDDAKLIYNVLWQLPYTPADAEASPMWLDLQTAHGAGELSEQHAKLLFSVPRPMFELYDLRNDQYETRNLINDPAWAARKEELRAALERWMIENRDHVPLPYLPDWQRSYEEGVEQRTIGVSALPVAPNEESGEVGQ